MFRWLAVLTCAFALCAGAFGMESSCVVGGARRRCEVSSARSSVTFSGMSDGVSYEAEVLSDGGWRGFLESAAFACSGEGSVLFHGGSLRLSFYGGVPFEREVHPVARLDGGSLALDFGGSFMLGIPLRQVERWQRDAGVPKRRVRPDEDFVPEGADVPADEGVAAFGKRYGGSFGGSF